MLWEPLINLNRERLIHNMRKGKIPIENTRLILSFWATGRHACDSTGYYQSHTHATGNLQKITALINIICTLQQRPHRDPKKKKSLWTRLHRWHPLWSLKQDGQGEYKRTETTRRQGRTMETATWFPIRKYQYNTLYSDHINSSIRSTNYSQQNQDPTYLRSEISGHR